MPKGIIGVSLEDLLEVPSERKLNDAGMMIVPCSFARTGSQTYSAGALGLKDRKEDEPVQVFRDEATVFEDGAMASFRSSPVTLGHPVLDGKPVSVTAENSKDFQVGFLEGLPVRDEDLLTGTLVISDQAAIDAIEEGKSELSAGYTCDLEFIDSEDGTTEIFQRNIRANHIAIVDRGRAGGSCRIADELDPEAEALAKEAKAKSVLEAKDKLITDAEEEVKAKDLIIEDLEGKLVVADEAVIEAIEARKVDITDAVSALVDTITKAKDIVDSVEYAGKSALEIRKEVLAEVQPDLDLTDRDEGYINARFDILFEDGQLETPMTVLLRKNAKVTVSDTKLVDPVAEARQRNIERNK